MQIYTPEELEENSSQETISSLHNNNNTSSQVLSDTLLNNDSQGVSDKESDIVKASETETELVPYDSKQHELIKVEGDEFALEKLGETESVKESIKEGATLSQMVSDQDQSQVGASERNNLEINKSENVAVAKSTNLDNSIEVQFDSADDTSENKAIQPSDNLIRQDVKKDTAMNESVFKHDFSQVETKDKIKPSLDGFNIVKASRTGTEIGVKVNQSDSIPKGEELFNHTTQTFVANGKESSTTEVAKKEVREDERSSDITKSGGANWAWMIFIILVFGAVAFYYFYGDLVHQYIKDF